MERMVITYEESPYVIYVAFEFEPRHLGIMVRVVVVDAQEVLASTLLPTRDVQRLVEWLSRWSSQPFFTPNWTLRYVKDDPDLEFALHEGSMVGRNLWMSPFEIEHATEALERFLTAT